MTQALAIAMVFVVSAAAGILLALLAVNVALLLRLRSRIPQDPPVDPASG
ncbi:hypothetical protein ACTWP6_17135 [Mycobacterium sp. 4D054]|nr:hypothetical protein [Mycobacterium sp. SMC-8]UXA12965.1 hypothetical protein KXD97_03645 [Mycobacterium sp. SMC-8]